VTEIYVESYADVAFTLWLALRDPRKVSKEAHVNLSVLERRLVAYSRLQNPVEPKRVGRPKKTSVPGAQSVIAVRQMFTNKQIEIALAVLASHENTRKRSK
jgi:hypothetical protein